MSDLKGIEYKRFEDIKHIREDGSEYWSARELGPALDYAKWENFAKVIKRAMIACENSGHSIPDDFPEVRKIVWNTVPAVFTCDHCSFNYFCKILPFCIIKCRSQFSRTPILASIFPDMLDIFKSFILYSF